MAYLRGVCLVLGPGVGCQLLVGLLLLLLVAGRVVVGELVLLVLPQPLLASLLGVGVRIGAGGAGAGAGAGGGVGAGNLINIKEDRALRHLLERLIGNYIKITPNIIFI